MHACGLELQHRSGCRNHASVQKTTGTCAHIYIKLSYESWQRDTERHQDRVNVEPFSTRLVPPSINNRAMDVCKGVVNIDTFMYILIMLNDGKKEKKKVRKNWNLAGGKGPCPSS